MERGGKRREERNGENRKNKKERRGEGEVKIREVIIGKLKLI